MKKTEMNYIKDSRENLIGFLHCSDEIKISNIIGGDYRADKKSYWTVCNEVLAMYDDKLISNEHASQVFEILRDSNSALRVESHRFENGKIFEYCADAKAYIFSKMGSLTEFRMVNHYL